MSIDKDVDNQVKSILSDDVIENSAEAGKDLSFSTGIVLSGKEYPSVDAAYERNDDNVEISLTVKGDGDKDFSENIDKMETTPTAVTLYIAGNEIDFITIDKLNSNQITVQYSNGDNLVLL